MKLLGLIICVVFVQIQAKATPEEDVWSKVESEAQRLFLNGEEEASAKILFEFAMTGKSVVSPVQSDRGRPAAVQSLCEVVRYMAATQNSTTNWIDRLTSLETTIKDVIETKIEKDKTPKLTIEERPPVVPFPSARPIKATDKNSIEGFTACLDSINDTTEFLYEIGRPGRVSKQMVQETMSKKESLDKEAGAALLDEIIDIGNEADRSSLANGVLKKMHPGTKISEDVLEILANGELAQRLEEKNPIQALRHYEKLWDIARSQIIMDDEFRKAVGDEIWEQVGDFVQKASRVASTSPWGVARRQKAQVIDKGRRNGNAFWTNLRGP